MSIIEQAANIAIHFADSTACKKGNFIRPPGRFRFLGQNIWNMLGGLVWLVSIQRTPIGHGAGSFTTATDVKNSLGKLAQIVVYGGGFGPRLCGLGLHAQHKGLGCSQACACVLIR